MIDEHGFTIDPRTGRSVGCPDAWAVSLYGAEERHRSLPSLQTLADYLTRHANRFAAAPNVYFGGWYDRKAGEWVLDVTCVTEQKAHAEAIGLLNKQRCIFHLRMKEEYWLPRETTFTSATTVQ